MKINVFPSVFIVTKMSLIVKGATRCYSHLAYTCLGLCLEIGSSRDVGNILKIGGGRSKKGHMTTPINGQRLTVEGAVCKICQKVGAWLLRPFVHLIVVLII